MNTKTAIRWFAVVLLSMSAALAKGKPKIVIEVRETQTSELPTSYTTPGSASKSTTDCTGSATAGGIGGSVATANGASNCTTTTTPGTPPRTVVGSIEQVHVQAIMPNRKRVTLWCQSGGFRNCMRLEPGQYDAEVNGNNVWMYVHDLGGKVHKTKYIYEGGW